MKNCLLSIILLLIAISFSFGAEEKGCRIGAFLADQPTAKDIAAFKKTFGKAPSLVMVFTDWDHYISEKVLNDIYSQGAQAIITWEPWSFESQLSINPNDLLAGRHDTYLSSFAKQLKTLKKPVFLRFAHEMNGNWYPWSGDKWGAEKYIAVCQHIHKLFARENANNVRWIFSINREDIPDTNSYHLYYPGDNFIDYIGIDGYNWGNTRPWSHWQTFSDLFLKIRKDILSRYSKPIIISEFSSTTQGGDKAIWIKNAMETLKEWPDTKAAVIFNIDKETDWHFTPGSTAAEELKKQLSHRYFTGR